MLDKNHELEIVKRLAGVKEEQRIEISKIGWTSRVYIIDFGDAGLYDRSQDFRGMYDEILLEAMMNAYGGDEIVSREASITTSKMIDVLNLIHCVENNYTDGVDNIDSCLKQVRLNILKEELQ